MPVILNSVISCEFSLEQRLLVESVQGMFNPFSCKAPTKSNIDVEHQKLSFFTSFNMKACNSQISLIFGLPNFKKNQHPMWLFLRIFLGISLAIIIPKSRKCELFCYKYSELLTKIPLWNEIHPFDNSVNH